MSKEDLWKIISELSLAEKQKEELKKLISENKNPFPGRIVDETVKNAEMLI